MDSPKNSLPSSTPNNPTDPDTSPIKRLKLTFNSLDSTKSGYIDKHILSQAIMYTGDNYDKQIIKQQIQKCGEKISLTKFMQIFQMAQIQLNQLMANQSIFRLYDKQNKGYIDARDLRRVAEIAGVELSEEEIGDMVGNLGDVDGRVGFGEFVGIMEDTRAWF